jgi:hypothetical protein
MCLIPVMNLIPVMKLDRSLLLVGRAAADRDFREALDYLALGEPEYGVQPIVTHDLDCHSQEAAMSVAH